MESKSGYKHIGAHLRADEVEQVRHIVKRFGFNSVYEFASSSMRLMLRAMSYIDRGAKCADVGAEISDEFANLYDYEEAELGAKPKWEGGELLALVLSGGKVDAMQVGTPSVSREYADEFVRRHYTTLLRKYSSRSQKSLESNGYTPLDIFADTIASLFECRESFCSYEDFEAFAMRKFDKRGAAF